MTLLLLNKKIYILLLPYLRPTPCSSVASACSVCIFRKAHFQEYHASNSKVGVNKHLELAYLLFSYMPKSIPGDKGKKRKPQDHATTQMATTCDTLFDVQLKPSSFGQRWTVWQKIIFYLTLWMYKNGQCSRTVQERVCRKCLKVCPTPEHTRGALQWIRCQSNALGLRSTVLDKRLRPHIIKPAEGRTPWVSSIVIIPKLEPQKIPICVERVHHYSCLHIAAVTGNRTVTKVEVTDMTCIDYTKGGTAQRYTAVPFWMGSSASFLDCCTANWPSQSVL